MPTKTAAKTEGKPSPLVDTRVIYCGDNLEQLKKLPMILKNRRNNHDLLCCKLRELQHRFPGSFCFQRPFGMLAEPSWFGFGIILDPSKSPPREHVISSLITNGIECRPIVAGNFTRNPVMKYINHVICGELAVADRIHDCGFFIGNTHVDLSEEIGHFINIFECALDARPMYKAA